MERLCWQRSKPNVLLKQLMKSDKFVSQIPRYNENPVAAVFDTTGLSNVIKLLCNLVTL
ncbi:hypothetical protein VCRA2113O411_110034 [Vibrio crassostreae]|nr:hypothetical protein VCRA2113O411_110034 [Vibrio crassostreae]CAK1724919.1 hypothetical protein VCRA2113O412_110132 [Vibrio crassostreae]CAK1725342.1 hypothetical protein VCRA2118O429_110132 [Vibrio crassostreae]CAK2103034.1 hypothetical protein VCRA2110O182_50026 [Vibrio crassostreae]CAK2282416.1 hypothetical protein VCRA2113O410_120034 [Vibrio crassostreae]